MPQYDGIVEHIGEDGRATVVIAPEQAGIPGASGVKVCHCAADSSTIRIEALNAAVAGIGDHVTVTRPAGVLWANFLALLVLPGTGLAAGLLVAGALWAAGPAGYLLWGAGGLAAGMALGWRIYARGSARNLSTITHIRQRCSGNTEMETPGPASCATCEHCH